MAAVYRYLHENGCRWPRPGVEGELIPMKTCGDMEYRHMASCRHRGLCIEGAVSYQNMIENIDWAPKVGYNSYMLEFLVPYMFFDNWYEHRNNNFLAPEKVSVDDVKQRCAWLETEIKKRGIAYHAVGHAWNCEPLGITGVGWIPKEEEMSDDVRECFAMIDGKRGLFQGIALNTNLCYSNTAVRRKMIDFIVDYARRNIHVDYLHIWLADGKNNQCECDECRKMIPADYYIILLNELDRELTAHNIDMKMVFVVYVDLFWPPKTQVFDNPDRFSLLFAPITRTYSKPYTSEPHGAGITEYDRNRLVFPESLAENLNYLREWKKMFKGDTFCYEYYFWVDHCYDPGYYDIAKIILKDIKCLDELGIDGLISDQSQRVYMPTGFPMYVMGQAMYNNSLSFDELARDFFATFGEDGEKCREYMAELSRLFNPVYLRGEEDNGGLSNAFISKEAAKRLENVRPLVDSFRPVIRKNMKNGCRCIAKSWKYLEFHAGMCERLADIYLERALGRDREARKLWANMHAWLSAHENDVQDAFDIYGYTNAMNSRLQ